MVKKKVGYIVSAVVWAVGYFYISVYLFFSVAGGHMLTGTILNIFYIVFALVQDKIEHRFLLWVNSRSKGDKKSLGLRIFNIVYGGASFKTSLYLFYVVIIICSAIVSAEPDFPYLSSFSGYLKSVEYGILLLVAADSFLGQFLKDVVKQ